MTRQGIFMTFGNPTVTDGEASMFDGDGTALFSSGSSPARHSDAMVGDATAMFSSGSAPAARVTDVTQAISTREESRSGSRPEKR